MNTTKFFKNNDSNDIYIIDDIYMMADGYDSKQNAIEKIMMELSAEGKQEELIFLLYHMDRIKVYHTSFFTLTQNMSYSRFYEKHFSEFGFFKIWID